MLPRRWIHPVREFARMALPALALEPARPSPFHDATRFAYTLPKPGHVTLDVFDVGGRRVARVETGVRSAGRHEVMWGGRAGSAAGSISSRRRPARRR